ncbi:hypothetical protein GCM10025879_15390 [Leuconostoc litchii]|nr:hypothetical protein GCM10025879_15390 [Leuconostoc litchii]
MQRRFPSAQVILFPAVVQGDKAAPNIIRQLKRIDEMNFDTLIVGRGGGSIEDLWAFNNEELVRTIAKLHTPVISSVGHETDNTLADLVADWRAATPTAAAELSTPVTLQQLTERLQELQIRQISLLKRMIDVRKQRLDRVANHVILKQPDRLYTGYSQRIDQLNHSLLQLTKQQMVKQEHQLVTLLQRQQQLQENILKPAKERLHLLGAKLDLVSPLKILSSGYSIVTNDDKVVRGIKDISVDDGVDIRLSDGKATATITGVKYE